MKKVIVLSLAVLLFVTACARDFAPLQTVEEKKSLEDAAQDNQRGSLEKEETQTKRPSEIAPREKLSEKKCKEVWTPTLNQLVNQQNPLLVIEMGKIIVTFAQGVSYVEAMNTLEEEGITFETVMEIFPLGKEAAQEEKFDASRRVKGGVKVKTGIINEEIDKVCKILQKENVEDATPAITLDFSKAAQQ